MEPGVGTMCPSGPTMNQIRGEVGSLMDDSAWPRWVGRWEVGLVGGSVGGFLDGRLGAQVVAGGVKHVE